MTARLGLLFQPHFVVGSSPDTADPLCYARATLAHSLYLNLYLLPTPARLPDARSSPIAPPLARTSFLARQLALSLPCAAHSVKKGDGGRTGQVEGGTAGREVRQDQLLRLE